MTEPLGSSPPPTAAAARDGAADRQSPYAQAVTRPIVALERVSFAYEAMDELAWAVEDVSLEVARGSHVAILGRNGSGKSTLARLITGLEIAAQGTVHFDGLDCADEELGWQVRRRCGLIFQNPDNQIVASTVEEDVAFGPENLGVPSEELRRRVERELGRVGLAGLELASPASLSGGQKQKLAIAGVLAMEPDCLILDEATSMLDPSARRSFLELVLDLRRRDGLTVINITHDMSEVMLADRVFVMHEGRILMSGSPAEIFRHVPQIRAIGLDVPAFAATSYALLKQHDMAMPLAAAGDEEEALRAIEARFRLRPEPLPPNWQAPQRLVRAEPAIVTHQLSYSYPQSGREGRPALRDVSLEVKRGEFFGIMGASGSGKSTLVQHFNGLLRAAPGRVTVLGHDLARAKDIRALRRRVQLLFQYPEHQLFAETVREDIAFGPRRLGVDEGEIEARIAEAAEITGLDLDWLERSPFELSGGEKRRVALAGILAMRPELLILDEPAAGLDPAGRDEILSYLHTLSRGEVTIVLVSHSMEDLSRLCDRVAILGDGELRALDTVDAIFENRAVLEANELAEPDLRRFMGRLADWIPGLDLRPRQVEDAVAELQRHLQPREATAGEGRA